MRAAHAEGGQPLSPTTGARAGLAVALAVIALIALARPGDAQAAPCPGDLKVVGLALTGKSCTEPA